MIYKSKATDSTKVPMRIRIGWGVGEVADFFILQTFLVLVYLIYNIGLGMNEVLLSLAIFIPRLADAVTDIWMGHISDNTRSRWGRRRPYIVIGTITSAILLPLLWVPPIHTDIAMFIYLLIMGLIFQLAYTVFSVPYIALGFELTTDYDERTRVLAWRMYFGQIASFAGPWLYLLCLKLQGLLNVKTNISAFWLSAVLGILIITTGIAPAIACRENMKIQSQAKIGIFTAMKDAVKNKAFIILLLGTIIVLVGLYSVINMGFYINIYYVCGTKKFAAKMSGIVGSMCGITSLLSIKMLTLLSVPLGKRKALIIGLTIALIGCIGNWFTLTPKMPYLQLVSIFISAIGMAGCYLLMSSMLADICDEDELKTGLRQEGIYSSVNTFAMKASIALTLIIFGFLLKFAGFNAKTAEAVGSVPIETCLKMKALLVGFQVISLVSTIILFYFYPITRARTEETRRILDERAKLKDVLTENVD